MSALAPEVEQFETNVLQPALQEVCDSPALRREYAPMMLTDPSIPSMAQGLSQQLVAALRRTPGTTLAIVKKELAPGLPANAGLYVMTTLYRQVGDTWCANPGVCFWMKFNNKLHVFDHRYDNAIANLSVGGITKYHVQNHILGSLDFFKLHALSDQPFPGYR